MKKLGQLDTRETNCMHGNYRCYEFFISEIKPSFGNSPDNSDWYVNLPAAPALGIGYARPNYVVSKSETNILIEDV